MPWVTVSPSPDPRPSPWTDIPWPPPMSATPPPPMPRPTISPTEMLSGVPGAGLGPQGHTNFGNVFRGFRQTTIDPILDLLGLGGSMGADVLSGDFAGAARTGMETQLGMDAGPREVVNTLGDAGAKLGIPGSNSPMLREMMSMLIKAIPGAQAIGVPAAQAGAKMARGITNPGEEGAGQFEEGMGNIMGLGLPMIDLLPKTGGAKLPPVAAAGMDLKGMMGKLTGMISDATPKLKVTEPKFMRDAAESAKFKDNMDWANRLPDRTPGSMGLDEKFKLFIEEMDKGKPPLDEANAGINIKDKLKKMFMPEDRPVDQSRRNFLKKAPAGIGAASKLGEVPKAIEAAAPDAAAVVANPNASMWKQSLEHWVKEIEEAVANPDVTAEGVHEWINEDASGTMRDLMYGDLDPETIGIPRADIEPLMNRLKVAFDKADEFDLAESAKTLERMRSYRPPINESATPSAPIKPSATERFAQRGVPKPELRVAPGEPASRKAFNQEQLALADPKKKLQFRNNAGFDPREKLSEIAKRLTDDQVITAAKMSAKNLQELYDYASPDAFRAYKEGKGRDHFLPNLGVKAGDIEEIGNLGASLDEAIRGVSAKDSLTGIEPWEQVKTTLKDIVGSKAYERYPDKIKLTIDNVQAIVDRLHKPKTPPSEANAGFDIVTPFRDAAKRIRESERPVPLTRSERTGSRVASLAERAVEGSYPGSGIFGRFRDRQQAALGKLADSVVESVSSFKGSAEEAGSHAQQALLKAQDGLKSQARQLYSEIDDIADGVKVSTNTLKLFAKDLKKAIESESQLIPPLALERAKSIVDRLTARTSGVKEGWGPNAPKEFRGLRKDAVPDKVSFATMQDVRSDLAAMARASGDLIPGKASGIAKKLASIADEAMQEAARKATKPELITKLREADKLWKETTATFNDSVVSRMVEGAPEKVHTLITKASLEDIRRVKKHLPEHVWQQAKAKVIEDVINASRTGEMAKTMFPYEAQQALGIEQPSAQQPKLKGSGMKRSLERVGEARLREIYSEKELQGIYSVAETADRIGKNQGGWVATILNYPLIYGAISGFTGDAAKGAATAGASVGIMVLAKMMTKPWGASVIKEYLKAAGTSGNRAGFWGARMGELFNQELEREKKRKKPSPRPSTSPSPQSQP